MPPLYRSCPQGREWWGEWLGGQEVRLPFCILNVLGDVLDDGELNFVEAASSLDAAKARVQSLAESWPGDYVIMTRQRESEDSFPQPRHHQRNCASIEDEARLHCKVRQEWEAGLLQVVQFSYARRLDHARHWNDRPI